MILLHPRKVLRIVKVYIHDLFWYYLVPDRVEISHIYKKYLGYKPNLKYPQTFNEKIQWLKLHDRKSEYNDLIDKYKVKKIIASIIGSDYIIPTIYGPYYNVDDIPWDKLPNQFVVKCNHDAASTIICKDKKSFDVTSAKVKLKNALKRNYYHYEGKQWGYKNIKRCVFVEQYMQDQNSDDLDDYKFMMFNGICKCLFTCTDRYTPSGLKLNFYTPVWELMPFTRSYPNTYHPMNKPAQLEEMLDIATELAKYVDNPFVRVDLYNINDHVYFGELTFYPGGGFEAFQPFEWDYKLGSWIDLSKGAK